jgi:uncharacterized protein Yka (UPF0111/DUF47 family)
MRLLPRDESFFDQFFEVARRAHEAAGHLHAMFTDKADRRPYCAETIKRLENECDEVTHNVFQRLDRTFITPIDREDIHLLAIALDDVIDMIDGTARRAEIFRLGAAPDGIAQLCVVVQRATGEIEQAVRKLRRGNGAISHCIEAKRLEEEGDAVYHSTLGKLFDQESDPIEIIKWKEIYDILETTIDQAEDVANAIESIVIKHA